MNEASWIKSSNSTSVKINGKLVCWRPVLTKCMMHCAEIGSHCREKHNLLPETVYNVSLYVCAHACDQTQWVVRQDIQLSVQGGLNGKDLSMSITPAQPPDGSPWSTYGPFQPTLKMLSTDSENIWGYFTKRGMSQFKQLLIYLLAH